MDPYAIHSPHEVIGSPKRPLLLRPYEMTYGHPFLTSDLFFDEDTNTLLKHIIDLGRFQQELRQYGEQILPRPQEDLKNPQVELGDQVLVKTWQEKGSPSQLSEKWTGPYQVVLVTSTAVKVKGLYAWVHNSRIKLYRRGRQALRLQNQRTTIPVSLLKTSDSCSGGIPLNLPQGSKMHPMMFLLFLIMSPCTAINLSINDAFTLANLTAS